MCPIMSVGITDRVRWEPAYEAGHDQGRVILGKCRSEEKCDEYDVGPKISENGALC